MTQRSRGRNNGTEKEGKNVGGRNFSAARDLIFWPTIFL